MFVGNISPAFEVFFARSYIFWHMLCPSYVFVTSNNITWRDIQGAANTNVIVIAVTKSASRIVNSLVWRAGSIRTITAWFLCFSFILFYFVTVHSRGGKNRVWKGNAGRLCGLFIDAVCIMLFGVELFYDELVWMEKEAVDCIKWFMNDKFEKIWKIAGMTLSR